jgi:hypothetical protein
MFVAAVVPLLLTDPGGGEPQTIRPTEDVTHVEIRIDAGSITSAAADELTVTLEQSIGRFGRTPTITAEVHEGTLRITASCTWRAVGRCGAHATVALPASVALKVRTEAGRIDVSGAAGGVDLRSGAGPIWVRDVTGGAQLRSRAGAIEGEVAHGTIDATTTAGPITLTVTDDLSRLSASTEVGPIELVVPDTTYAVDARTTLGRTRVEVSRDDTSDRVIQAHSEVGDVTVRTNEEGAQG